MALSPSEETGINTLLVSMFNTSSANLFQEIENFFVANGNDLSFLAAQMGTTEIFEAQFKGLSNEAQAESMLQRFGLTKDDVSGSAGSVAYAFFLQEIENGVPQAETLLAASSYLSSITARDPLFNDTAKLLDNKASVAKAVSDRGVAYSDLSAKVLTAVTLDAQSVTAAKALVGLIPTGTVSAEIQSTLSSIIDNVKAIADAGSTEGLTNLASYLALVGEKTGTATLDLATILTAVNSVTTSAVATPTLLEDAATLSSLAIATITGAATIDTVIEEVLTPTPPTPDPAIFSVTESANAVIDFAGSATGDITLTSWSGGVNAGTITFTRGGVSDETNVNITAGIKLGTETLIASAANLAGVTVEGAAATVKLTDTSLEASVLLALDGKVAGTLNAATVKTVTGSATEIAAVKAATGITLPADYAATLTSDTAANLNAALTTATAADALSMTLTDTNLANLADLNALALKTTGTITATSVIAVTGSVAEANTYAADANNDYTGEGNATTLTVDEAAAGTAADQYTLINLENFTNNIATGAAATTVLGNIGADTITGGVGADTITGGAGADTLDGGNGDDNFVYLLTADLFTGLTTVDLSLAGGVGTDDELLIGTTGTTFAIANNDAWAGVTTVETITAVANTAAVTAALDVTAYAAGIRTVDLSLADSGANNGNVIDISEYVGLDATILTGSTTGGNTITGGAGADAITGGALVDTITGGAGADAMTGGTGVDTFIIGATDSLNTALDTITDYTAGTDILDLQIVPTSLVAGALTAQFTTAVDVVSSGATAGTLATDIAAAVAAQIVVDATFWDLTGDTIAVTLTGASVAGTGAIYIVQNQFNDTSYDTAADTVIALIGTSTVPTSLIDFA